MHRRKFIKITIPLALAPGVTAGKHDRPEFSYGVIADPQYADYPAKGSRHYRRSLGKLKTCILELNRHALDGVVTLGDVIDRDFKSFSQIMPIYAGLKVPHKIVLGNHDFSVADQDKAKVLGALGLKVAYRSEVHGRWRFIYLDGTEVSVFRYLKSDPRTLEARAMMARLRAAGAAQAVAWNGGVSAQQLTWLRRELETSKVANQKVVICCHFPVQPNGDGHNLWNASELVTLIEAYPNVVAFMNGHNHRGSYHLHKGCHFLNFKGMVETENQTAYSVVRGFSDRIEIDGYGTESDRRLD